MAKTILIVDDADNLRRLVKSSLKSAGFEVIEAVDGQTALQLLDGKSIDAIVTDLRMPVMDGISFVKAVRLSAQYRTVPVLMLTAEGQEGMIAEGKLAGVSTWMLKPFSPRQLAEAVSALCR